MVRYPILNLELIFEFLLSKGDQDLFAEEEDEEVNLIFFQRSYDTNCVK